MNQAKHGGILCRVQSAMGTQNCRRAFVRDSFPEHRICRKRPSGLVGGAKSESRSDGPAHRRNITALSLYQPQPADETVTRGKLAGQITSHAEHGVA